MKRKILCPTDFSPASDAALVFAASLARGTNSQLLIVHVGDTNLGHPGEGVYLPPTAAAKAEVARLLRQVVPDECDDYEHRLAVGDPATEIQRLAEAENVEAIVMGTHGRGALSRMLMGSVAEDVTRHATCPVLTVTVPEKQRASTKLV
jgi:universal stress protein A